MRPFLPALLAIALTVIAPPARAEIDQTAAIDRVVAGFIRPGYADLAARSRDLADSFAGLCPAATPTAVAATRAAFQKAADAWATIEIVRIGPIADDLNYDRMDHYPERKGIIGRGLAGLYALPEGADLADTRMNEVSVAVQGFSAVERILFDPDAEAQLLGDGPAGHRRCAIGKAIAGGIATRSAALSAGWAGLTAARLPDDARTTLGLIATDVLTLYKLVGDTKISGVIGAAPDAMNEKAGPMWRSGRATRIVALNLAAAARVTELLVEGIPAGRDIAVAARAAADAAARLPGPIDRLAASARTRGRVMQLLTALRTARDGINTNLPGVLGITLGFNALDGD
jgi:hypothetical protein